MAIESCSAKEQYSVLQCMKATAAHVDDWEKHSRLGIEADDLQQVIARWPRSSAGECAGMSGMELLSQFLHPARKRKGNLAEHRNCHNKQGSSPFNGVSCAAGRGV